MNLSRYHTGCRSFFGGLFFVPSRIKNQIINLKNPVFPQFFDGFVDVSTAIINSNNREREQTHPPTPDSPRIGELKGERRER